MNPYRVNASMDYEQGHPSFPTNEQALALAYLGSELTILIEMYGLQPVIVEHLSLSRGRPPGIEDIGSREGKHWPRERIGERARVFPILEKPQIVTFEC